MSYMDNFPGEPRDDQEDVINKIEHAFEDEGKIRNMSSSNWNW